MELAFRCLVGCVAVQGGMVPEIRLPPKRVEQLGYSMLPLPDPGWRVLRRTPTLLAIGKAGRQEDETLAIQAGTYNVRAESEPALMRHAEADVAQRFRVIESSSAPDERASCTRRHLVTEDRAPGRRSGSKQPMILEAMMLTCVHPGDAELGIAIMYSQRYDTGNRDPGFDAKAAEVLRELRFTAVRDAR